MANKFLVCILTITKNYLKNNDISIKNGTDVNSVMRDMMSVLLEGALTEELNEKLGYSKYDYRNKDTDNAGTDIPVKSCIPVTETWILQFPVTGMANTNPGLSKVPEYRDTGHRRKDVLGMYVGYIYEECH